VKVVGLMSGTSVDGIDTAVVEIQGDKLDIAVSWLDGAVFPYETALKEQILAVAGGKSLNLAQLAQLDDAIATAFAQAANHFLEKYSDISLIGSHGQTLYHRPPIKETQNLGYSLQLGRGELIANLTGITTVSNFRTSDIAAYGQGAPLVPKVDGALLAHPTKYRCIQNIGGMANVTYLPPKQLQGWEDKISGWDTGPGNVLIDLAVQTLTQGVQKFDRDGQWAATGQPNQILVDKWLAGEFFQQSPPKSTGRELFSKEYLALCAQQAQAWGLNDADWLASLTELTVASIVHDYQMFLPRMPDQVILCGGGSYNLYLKQRLQARLGEEITVLSTDDLGISAKFKEALAFAVLAYWRFLVKFPGNLPKVTGAKQAVLLGSVYLPFG